MEGLREAEINAAKRARDLVVHEGAYPSASGDGSELFDHAVVVRELVARFILAALGYEGPHYSFLGGWHERSTKLAPLAEEAP
jgi:hypothetical protein